MFIIYFIMAPITQFTSRLFVACVCLLLYSTDSYAQVTQTLTAKHIKVHTTVMGFYESLPAGYNTENKTYPLIVFNHGVGELGSGDAASLPKVLSNGIPKLIKEHRFPISFKVKGEKFSFIVIMPQYTNWGSQAASVNAVIDYAIKHYKVDINRIYVTGLSMGGGFAMKTAGASVSSGERLAAIVPMCPATAYDAKQGANIAHANLPIWAFCNSGDAYLQNTINWVDGINAIGSSKFKVSARKTIFDAAGHDCWTQASDPNYRENGQNIYEWMLHYSRGATLLPGEMLIRGTTDSIRVHGYYEKINIF